MVRKKGILFLHRRKSFYKAEKGKRRFSRATVFANIRHNWFWKLKQRLKQKFSTGTLSLAFVFYIIFIFGTTRLPQGRNGKSHCQAV